MDSKPVKWSPIHLSGQQRRPLEAEEPTHYQIRVDEVSAPENLTFVLVSNLKEWTYDLKTRRHRPILAGVGFSSPVATA